MSTQGTIAQVERMAEQAPAMRIGDAERWAVAEELSRHTAQGRLDMDELEERLGAVYGAKTAPELVAVLAGLRAATPPLWPSQGASHTGAQRTVPCAAWAPRADATPPPRRARHRSTWVRAVGGLLAIGLGHWAGLALVDAAALWGVLILTRSRAITVLSVLGLLGGHNSVGGWGHFVPIALALLVLLHRLGKARHGGGQPCGADGRGRLGQSGHVEGAQ
jgi:hypothetical protein